MKKVILVCFVALLSSNLKAQFNFSPITQLITDSISVVGQAGQNCGFLSSLGFYPVNPATGEFVLGAPQVKKARLHLKNHKMFTIEASNFSLENIYQEKPKLNDAEIVKPTISYHQIISGGTLHFLMKDK